MSKVQIMTNEDVENKIEDSCDSSSTTEMLSANQGRLLLESINTLIPKIEMLEKSIKEMHYLN